LQQGRIKYSRRLSQRIGQQFKPCNQANGTENVADFYVGPNGQVIPSHLRHWIGTNMRQSYMNAANNQRLKNLIGEIYRPTSVIGDGGTAAALRFEQATGRLLSPAGHVQKATNMSTALHNLIESGTLNYSDTQLAQKLMFDLLEALVGS